MNKPAEKTFDFQNGEYHPHKKQKREDGSAARADKHKEVIDLDSRKTPSARSLYSHTQNGQPMSNGSRRGNLVAEFHNVENIVQPNKNRRRVSGASHGQALKTSGASKFANPSTSGKWVGKHGDAMEGEGHEDHADPIVDPNMDIAYNLQKTTPQVIITSGYKGNAGSELARGRQNGSASNISTMAQKQTLQASHYFTTTDNGRKRRNSSDPNSDGEWTLVKSTQTTKQQNGGPIQRKGASCLSSDRRESDASLDELADDPQHPQTAQHIPRKRKQGTGSLVAAKNESHFNVDDDNSDNEHKKADMVTDSIPKGKRRKKTPKGEFKVIQVFSERHKWLFHGHEQPWSLVQDPESGNLAILNDQGVAVKELELFPRSFSQIHRCRENGKVFIIKSADQTAKNADKICLELGDSDQSEDFSDNVKDPSRTIVIVKRMVDW